MIFTKKPSVSLYESRDGATAKSGVPRPWRGESGQNNKCSLHILLKVQPPEDIILGQRAI